MRGFAKFSRAFTLIEIVVAITVFAIAMTFLIVAFNPAVRDSANPAVQIKAAELGQAYIEEIIGKKYDQANTMGSRTRCGEAGVAACSIGNDGEARFNYNDVDDYHNVTENPPRDALGNVRSSYTGYSVSVNVIFAGADLSLNNNDAKRVDVSVTHISSASNYNFSVYKTNF